MIRRISIASAALAFCAAGPAVAGDAISNSYVEANYLNSVVETTVDGNPTVADDEVEGFDGAVSVGLLPFLNLVGAYDQRRYQSIREGFASAGLAGHTTGRNFQAFGAATYEQLEYDDERAARSLFEATQDGWGVSLGVKYAMPNFEVSTSAKYSRFSDLYDIRTPEASRTKYGLTAMTYQIGAVLQLTPYWAQTFGGRMRTVDFEPNDTTAGFQFEQLEWTVGFRRYFVTSADKWKRKGGLLWWGE